MDRKKKFTSILAGIMAAVLLLGTVLGLLASTVKGASSSEISQQITQLKGEQAELESQLKELEDKMAAHTGQMQDMVDRKNSIDQQIALLYSQIRNVSQQVSAYNLMIADKQEELDLAEENLEKLQKKFKDRIRAMEEQGDLSYWSVIFRANSFADLLDRLNMMAEIANADKKRLEALETAAKEVSAAREKLTVEKLALEITKQELAQSEQTLADKRAEVDLLLQSMIAKGDEFQKEIEESEKMQEDLMQQLGKLEDDFDKAKYEEWLATSAPPTTTNPGGPGNMVNGVVWYVPTTNFRISSHFGERKDPFTGEKKWHSGVDMAAPEGTPIYATRTGVVTIASYQDGGAGYYVKLNHGDGFSSIYMHMTHYVVKVGQYVSAGEIIGYVGSTGRSTGPHLHFGIAKNGSYVNPLNYIKV